MNLPILEPIVWKWGNREEKPYEISLSRTDQVSIPQESHCVNNAVITPPQKEIPSSIILQQVVAKMPPPQKEDFRHDFIGSDGILHIHYPGIPELN